MYFRTVVGERRAVKERRREGRGEAVRLLIRGRKEVILAQKKHVAFYP